MTNEHLNLEYKQPGDFRGLKTLRDQAESLQPLDFTVDVNRLGTFIPTGKVEIGAITEHLGPGSGEGLQLSTDLGRLDEGLRELWEQEANAKLRRLLEQAQGKFRQEKFQSAIALLDQALEIDPANAPALLLKGNCHFALGEFDNALELVTKALEHASDPQTAILALVLRAACEQGAMRQFEHELAELLENGRRDEAIERVKRRMRRFPDNPTLLYAHCALLLSADRLAEAKAAAERALNVVSRANAEHFRNLLRHIAVQESHETLESVRLLLRRGDAGSAITRLDTCSAAIRGDEQFEALRSYAHERYVGTAHLGRARRARMRRADVRRLAGPALAQLLCWLVQEELQAGMEALNTERFAQAEGWFAAAEKIDDRCDIVAFLHAVALFREVQQAFERKKPPSLDHARADLQRAARLAAQAIRDPMVGEQCKALASAIAGNLGALEKARKVSECVSRFNALVTHYERSPIRSRADLTTARRSFRQLAADVNGLRNQQAPDSPERQALDELTLAIRRIEKQLAA